MILASLYVGACVLLTLGLIGAVGLCIFILGVRIGAFGFICGISFVVCWFNRELGDLILFWVYLYIVCVGGFQDFSLIFVHELIYFIV
jgi:hypothetical protein